MLTGYKAEVEDSALAAAKSQEYEVMFAWLEKYAPEVQVAYPKSYPQLYLCAKILSLALEIIERKE